MCDATPTTSGRLSCNDRLAERNRGFFRAKRVFVVRLLAFPHAGVRQFVARTLSDNARRQRLRVLSPELLAQFQALSDAGSGRARRLDACGINQVLDRLDLDRTDIVLLEDSCDSRTRKIADLGETACVALVSVRDYAQFPRKAAPLLRQADAIVITEMNLAPAAGVEPAQARAAFAKVAPHAQLITVASATGAGMEAWHEFLDAGVEQANA